MPEGKRAGEVVSSPMPSASYTAAAPYPRDLVSQISPHLSLAPSGSFIAAPSVASTGPPRGSLWLGRLWASLSASARPTASSEAHCEIYIVSFEVSLCRSSAFT